MHTGIEILCCPDCGATVRHTVRHNGLRAGGTSIGPPAIPCPACGTWVATGESEWDDKGFLQRSWFVITRLVWFVVGSIFVAGFLALIVGWAGVQSRLVPPAHHVTCLLITFGLGTLLIGVLLGRNAILEIRESRRRTEAAASAGQEEVQRLN